MTNVSKLINKVSKALKAQGRMPLIDQRQFYGNYGPVTKYIVHYGHPVGKDSDAIAEVYSKKDLLEVLTGILKNGDSEKSSDDNGGEEDE